MGKKRKNKRMRKRLWFTATERVEVWDRWQRGESSQSIGRVLDRGGPAIHRQLTVYGGIRPQSRCRSSRALTLVEREEISRGIAAKESIRLIAVRLGRSPSTVSREVSRNGGSDSYRASEADERTWERARRPKSCRLARSPRLRQLVEEKLRQVWSPEQIAGWLKHSYSGRRVASRVPRDDLSQPFCPGPRGFEERTDSVSADKTHDSPIWKSEPERPWKGTDRIHDLDP